VVIPIQDAASSDLQRKSQFEFGPTMLIANPGFLSRELEDHLGFENRNLARHVRPTDKCRLPAVHRALLEGRTIRLYKARSANH
jgi:hypothetical protein